MSYDWTEGHCLWCFGVYAHSGWCSKPDDVHSGPAEEDEDTP